MATKLIRKFKFSDLKLAFKVRGNMLAVLTQFDANQNKLFDEQQIKQAMVTILGEDEHQVHYVVKNVFRYDRDGDRCVTYTQFTNFSVQQHFGQMAIQRLHKKGYYANGAKRVMNLEQFEATLNYCLGYINSQGSHSEYERLFNQVDLDRDGFISYQDYFIFLRQYFGSQSEAFEEQIKKDKEPKPQPPKPDPVPIVPPSNFTDGNGETPQQRFAKLVYSQFKISVMQGDKNKNLILERNEAEQILSSILRLNYSQITPLLNSIMSGSNTVKYEDFMRSAVVTYMSSLGLQRNVQGQNVSESQFVDSVNRLCHFINVKPAEHVVRACFKAGSRGGSSMSQGDLSSTMRNIFENYRFDTRGLPSTRPKSQRFDAIAPKNYY